ncbi:MAG: TPM domain-containing protein [Terracidiphilus sp.]
MTGFRRAHSAVFRLLLAALFVVPAVAALPERVEDLPTPTGYVSDLAHVLSPDAVARLERLCAQMDTSAANAQIHVVTIQTLDGDEASDFAGRLEEKWKVGRKGSDRGILMLFAIQDHQRWIEVGYGLEGILPDGKIGDIGREMVPFLKAGDYDGGITTGVQEIANVIAADAKVTLSEEDARLPAQPAVSTHVGAGNARLIFYLVFFGIFILVRILSRVGVLPRSWGRGGVWINTGGGWGGGGGFGGGGGDSGGGSDFGMGGGSSGGGGAGGSW